MQGVNKSQNENPCLEFSKNSLGQWPKGCQTWPGVRKGKSKQEVPKESVTGKPLTGKGQTLEEWKNVRIHVNEHGMRNSNVMAIAPTATIGYINGVEQSIEPNFSTLFVYENKSGNFYITNEHFIKGWSDILANLLARYVQK